MDNLSMIALNGNDVTAIANPITVTISQAAVDHVTAWTADQKTKAVHEAGHAVASAVLGVKLVAASIKGNKGGHVELGTDDDDQPMFRSDTVVRKGIVVSMAGLAAEVALLGEGSLGSESDISAATNQAMSRLASGLDPAYPPIATNAWAFSNIPSVLSNLQAELIIAELTRARSEADRLIAAHQEQVMGFAVILFRARRLEGDALDAAIRAVGLEPAPRGAALG